MIGSLATYGPLSLDHGLDGDSTQPVSFFRTVNLQTRNNPQQVVATLERDMFPSKPSGNVT